MKTSTIDWLITELKETNDENKALREDLNNLREALADIILDPVTTTSEGNHLTGSQIRDRQIAAISALIFAISIACSFRCLSRLYISFVMLSASVAIALAFWVFLFNSSKDD